MINFKKSISKRKFAVIVSLLVAVLIATVTKNIVFIAVPFIVLPFLKLLDLQKKLSRVSERIEALEQSFNDQNGFALDKSKKIEGSFNKLAPSKTDIDSKDLVKKIEYNQQQIEKIANDLGWIEKEYRDEIDSLSSELNTIEEKIHQLTSLVQILIYQRKLLNLTFKMS